MAIFAEAHQVVRVGRRLLRLAALTGWMECHPLELMFCWPDGERTLIRVRIVASWQSPKGARLWFACPGCEQRVGALYAAAPGEPFACRRCKRLRYVTQLRPRAIERLAAQGVAWAKAAQARPRGSRQWSNWRPGRRRTSAAWVERGALMAAPERAPRRRP